MFEKITPPSKGLCKKFPDGATYTAAEDAVSVPVGATGTCMTNCVELIILETKFAPFGGFDPEVVIPVTATSLPMERP